ncbi:MAG: class I SAM-dependent methyltransferase [Thermoplasmata archaeon]
MEEIETREINCPICSSKDYEVVYKKEYRVWGKNKLFIWTAQQAICTTCGMIFTNPRPTDKTLEHFYKSDMRYGERSDFFRRSQLEFIYNNTPKNCKSIFDIGAFDGRFLNIARSRGYVVFGIEPSEEGVQEAMNKYGIRIIKGFFNENFLNSFSEKFDIITIIHVLEHIQNPLDFLKSTIKITNPNKYIYIEVPDTSRPFVNNIADFFSNQHIMHYTEGSLRNIASILGLHVVAVEKLQEIPIIRILLKNEKVEKCTLKNEYEINKNIMKEYKHRRTKFIQHLKSKINPNIKKIIIYGAGMHTTQLLQSGLLNNVKIDCIVDFNPKKHGMLFEGYEVQSPEILKNKNIPVFISSYDSQEEISDYLKVNFPHITQIKIYDKIISFDTGIFVDDENVRC